MKDLKHSRSAGAPSRATVAGPTGRGALSFTILMDGVHALCCDAVVQGNDDRAGQIHGLEVLWLCSRALQNGLLRGEMNLAAMRMRPKEATAPSWR